MRIFLLLVRIRIEGEQSAENARTHDQPNHRLAADHKVLRAPSGAGLHLFKGEEIVLQIGIVSFRLCVLYDE